MKRPAPPSPLRVDARVDALADTLAAEHVGVAVPAVLPDLISQSAPPASFPSPVFAPANMRWPWPQLPGYRIVDEIAAGGMAVIYRAVQESLRRKVAIKALRSDVKTAPGEPDWRDRFIREARLLARFKHPNLVEVYDLIAAPGQRIDQDGYADGELASGPLFIVMELCEGIDLLDVLGAVPVLPPAVAATIALGAARGLAHIHAAGIVHRDVKPANLLLTRLGEVKLVDLGTAWDPQNPRDLSGDEIGLGTPSYMSPEQARGERIDPRSDQFALGCVLYQMLAGRKPFVEPPGPGGHANPLAVLEQVAYAEPPPLLEKSPAVPRRLVRIVERCLKKRPSERYLTTDELVLALVDCRDADRDPAGRILRFLLDENLLPSPPQPPATPSSEPPGRARRLFSRLFSRGQGPGA